MVSLIGIKKWQVFGGVIVILCCLLFFCMHKTPETKFIEKNKAELFKIIDSNDTESVKIENLKKLAKKVGAGTENTKIVGSDTHQEGSATVTYTHQNPISEAELVQNIHQSLQTLSMIEACKISAKSYKVAFFAAVASAISACVSFVIARSSDLSERRSNLKADDNKML